MPTKAEVISKAQAQDAQINANFNWLKTQLNNKADSSAIPTVNNGTLTIQKNGANVATFTADQATNVTANIAVPTTVAELSDSGNYALKSDVSSAVKPKGSVAAVTDLPAASSSNVGWMYNFTAEFTTTADFVEGAGKKYPVGTNVVIVEPTAGTYKYDVFSGFVDTSAYDSHITNTTIHVTAAEKNTWNAKQDALTTAQINAIAAVANKADKATTLSGYGITDAYTKTETDTYLNDCFDTTIVDLTA